MAQDNEEELLELAREEYLEAQPAGDEKPTKKWLLALLLAYDPVTKYVYQHEIDRKRARTAEAIIASSDKALEFRRGLRYWQNMTDWYAIDVTDMAVLKSYEDAGVKRVRWISLEDGRECSTCSERSGKVYPINQIPPKPHLNCRCMYEPVFEGEV